MAYAKATLRTRCQEGISRESRVSHGLEASCTFNATLESEHTPNLFDTRHLQVTGHVHRILTYTESKSASAIIP